VVLEATVAVSSATIEVATTQTYVQPGFYTTVFQVMDDSGCDRLGNTQRRCLDADADPDVYSNQQADADEYANADRDVARRRSLRA
jgi:hypothetical protein